MLGESVIGVIVWLSELVERGALDGLGIVLGVVGLAIGFAIWWIDFVARRVRCSSPRCSGCTCTWQG